MGDEVVDRGVTKNGVRGNVLLWGGGTWAGVKLIFHMCTYNYAI